MENPGKTDLQLVTIYYTNFTQAKLKIIYIFYQKQNLDLEPAIEITDDDDNDWYSG